MIRANAFRSLFTAAVVASPSAGDALPSDCELIEVRVSELTQLFNAMDPSAFRERDLHPDAEAFIAEWAKEAPPAAPLGLAVYVDRAAGCVNEPGELRDAVHAFFRHRAERSRGELRGLFRRGRTSLVIGVCALGVSLAASDFVGRVFSHHAAGLLTESLLIGGWVAMW